MRRGLCIVWLATCCAAGAVAQEQLAVEGPVPALLLVDEVARVVLHVQGRTADPGRITLPDVPGLRMQISPPSRRSETFFDGRTMSERVGISYLLTIQPQREGSFVVPPFTFWTGTREQTTPELRLDVRKELHGRELGYLDVRVEPQRVYVHEPVRVRVEFGVQEGLRLVEDTANLRYRYQDVEVQAPWLSEFPGGEPLELPVPPNARQLVVVNRALAYAESLPAHERAGQRWQAFVFEKAFLPTRIGRIELPAPLLRYHVLRGAQRDLFGGSRRNSDNLYCYGQPASIEVLPLPEEGRPEPYYGGVGRFTLQAKADRTSLQVRQSVKLTLTVRGQGNLQFLQLPPLDAVPGLHKLGQKEVPRSPEMAQVVYDLTPLSADVREIPAIEWNYFDTTPGVEKYVTVRTPPIPLRVQPLADGDALAPLPESAPAAVQPGVDDIFDLPELQGPAAVPVAAPAWLRWTAVFGPWLLVVLGRGLWSRWRRRAADLRGQRARTAKRRFEQALAAGEEPSDALAAYLGDRLDVPAAAMIRADLAEELVTHGLDPELAAEAAANIERGTSARYGGGEQPDAGAVRGLVQRLERERFGARLLPWLLLPVLACGAARAQAEPLRLAVGDPDVAVADYRNGDYAAAERGFAAALQATGDYRLWQARGNCFYRMERLAEALWAYEVAALASPRDAELRGNLRVVRQRLGLVAADAGFTAELLMLRDRFTARERALLAALLMALGAGCLVLGWRRVGLRWIGVLVLLPAGLVALDLLWLGPARPRRAIALQELQITAEPRLGMAAVATVQPGVALDVLGGTDGAFVRVQAGERAGFAPRAALGVVR